MFCSDTWPFSAIWEARSQRAARDALWPLPSKEEPPRSSSMGAWFCSYVGKGRSWLFTILCPTVCQRGPVPTPLLSPSSGAEPGLRRCLHLPSRFGGPVRFWGPPGHGAQLVCQEPVCTSLGAMGACCALDMFPCWVGFFFGGGPSVCSPGGSFGTCCSERGAPWLPRKGCRPNSSHRSCAAGQHLARCCPSSLQQRACAACWHPGLEGMAWKCPSGALGSGRKTLPSLGTARLATWGGSLQGQILEDGGAGASRCVRSRVGPCEGATGAWLAVAGSQPRWAFLCREQLAMGDLPAAQSSRALAQGSDSSGSPPCRQGGWQRCLECALAPRRASAVCWQVPAWLSGMRCFSLLASLFAKRNHAQPSEPDSPRSAVKRMPEPRCQPGAAAGRSRFAPAAGRAAAPARRWRPCRLLPPSPAAPAHARLAAVWLDKQPCAAGLASE